ncbi:hypothetical protein, partial [Klebsiella pneumoniae]|uniref:hypothetical protein n=1 Tax=Klebsiella pneumoniae TaxID=573 RepID=UPI00371117A8
RIRPAQPLTTTDAPRAHGRGGRQPHACSPRPEEEPPSGMHHRCGATFAVSATAAASNARERAEELRQLSAPD